MNPFAWKELKRWIKRYYLPHISVVIIEEMDRIEKDAVPRPEMQNCPYYRREK